MGGLFDSDLIPLLFVLVMLANVFLDRRNRRRRRQQELPPGDPLDAASLHRSSRRRRQSSKRRLSLKILLLNLNAA